MNEQTKLKHTHRYKQSDGGLVGGGLGTGWIGKEMEKYRSELTELSQEAKYSAGNVIGHSVMSTGRVPEISGETLCKVYACLTTMPNT